MRILITNDDGIMSEGIIILARKLSEVGEVHVVAPDIERSATGHAITIRNPLWAKEVKFGNEFFGYAVNGTPADCVKLGIQAILGDKKVDLVLSGVNKGANLGTDVMYSGTVSGALEGAMMEVPSIAISSCSTSNPNFMSATKALVELIKHIDFSNFPKFSAINLNVPAVDYDDLKGFKLTHQSKRRFRDFFEARQDPFGNTYYWMLGEIVEDDRDPQADYHAVEQGYVSVTPITMFHNDPEFMKILKKESFFEH
ncbi:MAG: 5'/3'-nucleotidase SurE [Thermotogae bacterium]|jgi:5'-nucleotidase|uniref:5'/3'-nucleotidase SurE n=1 Tax=Athalassotoga sp. TaxID=2022597 RepID=UPI003D06CCDB|nr:5'/3'-nucleotidase SurE [Thermotogota bacterium]MCL5031932.1 5'/3'-nucleotidase SurE [Thermotogota bacterium]